MIIIMLGAPGTGKGTVSSILSERLKLPHVSSGDIFRNEIKNKTALAKELDEYLSKGALVPDELTIRIISERLKQPDLKEGVILDGFPRTEEQAIKLDEMLANENKKVDVVLNLITPEEELVERIVNRRICSNPECKTIYNLKLNPPKQEGVCNVCGSKLIQRKDDNEETVKNRFREYINLSSKLVEYYGKKEILYTAEVTERLNKFGKEVAEEFITYLERK